ncbi:MAG: hypothetical protein ACRDLL_12775 [Solirubrobacterales bacterium]
MIETEAGVLVREIPPALPLRSDIPMGPAAEEAAHNAAALWGLPDVVYRARIRRVGAGSREVGDRLLLLDRHAIVIQVKSRAAASEDADRERRWVAKHTDAALKQAKGTIRSLNAAPIRAVNGRGDEIEIRPDQYQWSAVVVLDHPNPPDGVVPTLDPLSRDACVMLRRDWEFLWEQLRSAHAVGGYLRRTAGDPIELGDEPVRYFELALADQTAEPTPLNPALIGTTGRRASTPLLPLVSTGTDDRAPFLVLRSIFEDIATIPFEADRRLRVLAELDRLPVSQRGEIGQALIDGLARVSKTPAGMTEWRPRRVIGPLDGQLSVHLGFGVCSEYSRLHEEAFRAWVALRHHETQEITRELDELTTVGVLLTPRHDGKRPWDTTLVAVLGNLELDEKTVAAYKAIWKGFDEASIEHPSGQL